MPTTPAQTALEGPPRRARGERRPDPGNPSRRAAHEKTKSWFARGSEWIPVMILPQVHLRKPCYDFSFL